MGIENDTHDTVGKPPPEGVAPLQTNSGIENDTLQSRRGKPPHKRNAPHANTGIENDTRQKRVAFNDMRAFALNGMRTLAEC